MLVNRKVQPRSIQCCYRDVGGRLGFEEEACGTRWAASPFSCPTAAGFVVDETSQPGVISRGWNAPGWLGHKRPIIVFGRHKRDDGHFRGPLDPNGATSLTCRPVRFR